MSNQQQMSSGAIASPAAGTGATSPSNVPIYVQNATQAQQGGQAPVYLPFGEDEHSQQANLLRNWFQFNTQGGSNLNQMYGTLSPQQQSQWFDNPITRGGLIYNDLQNQQGWKPYTDPTTGQARGLIAPWAGQGYTPANSGQAVWQNYNTQYTPGGQQGSPQAQPPQMQPPTPAPAGGAPPSGQGGKGAPPQAQPMPFTPTGPFQQSSQWGQPPYNPYSPMSAYGSPYGMSPWSTPNYGWNPYTGIVGGLGANPQLASYQPGSPTSAGTGMTQPGAMTPGGSSKSGF